MSGRGWSAVGPAVITLAVAGVMASASKEDPAAMRCVSQGETLSIWRGDRPVAAYRHEGAAFKPYVSELRTPAGLNVLRDAPADHLHHHGLMFAVSVEGVDFWAEGDTQVNGRQIHLEPPQPGDEGFDDAVIDWTAPDGRQIAMERRSIQAASQKNPAVTLLTWRSVLAAGDGREQIELTGNHYFGLGARFIEAMDRDGQFLTDEGDVTVRGQVVRGSERLTPGRWCAYVAGAGDRMVTVAFFDHPANPRPARWFTMTEPFAYLSATLNLHEDPLIVRCEGPITLTYGVGVWDGEQRAETIEAGYRAWLDTESVTAAP